MECPECVKCRRPRLGDFDLQHDRPEHFVTSQFGPPSVAVVWHTVWTSYFIVTLLLELLVYNTAESKPIWLVYAKNWACLLVILTSLTEVLTRLISIFIHKEVLNGECRTMLFHLKIQWVFQNINNTISILVMGLYALLIDKDVSFVYFNRLISPSVYVLLSSSVINMQPVKFFHFYQPSVLTLVFVLISSIVQKSASNVPNKSLIFRCDNPLGTALVSLCVIVVIIPVIHILFFSLYKLRIFLCKTRFDKISGSTCSLQAAIQRDITATDVVLEDSARVTYIDIKPDVKDDIGVHLGTSNSGETTDEINKRVNRSEADLRDYRSRNGLYCDFAQPTGITHHTELHEVETDKYSQGGASGDTSKGSQIILVKACNGYVNEAFEDDTSSIQDDNQSNASSDFLSEYINTEILAYM